MPSEDTVFSQYLRSRSPSCSYTKDTGDSNSDTGSIQSHATIPRDVCLYTEKQSHLADSMDPSTVDPKDAPIKTKKPRLTLCMRQPEQKPKPKILLRLRQPKQVPGAQKSVGRAKPGVNNRSRRRH